MIEHDEMDFCGELCNFAEGLIKKAKPQWIPVSERLPEGDKVVLCYKAERGIRFGKLLDATYANGVQAFMDRDRVFAFGVTHWMPLPEPPKEGE